MTAEADTPTPDEAAAGAGVAGSKKPVAPWIALAIAVVLTGLFVVLVNADPDEGPGNRQSRLVGQIAPEAVGTLLDGDSFDLSRRKGSWVILNFFRADCQPCIVEHPDLVEFVEQQNALPARDAAEFYSVVVGDTRDDVEEFFDKRGGDWPVIMDHEQIDVAFGVAQVPETWIVDPNGIVNVRFTGLVSTEDLNVQMQQLREAARS